LWISRVETPEMGRMTEPGRANPYPIPMNRLPNVDLLRGTVMVLMALDHVRDFFSNALDINPADPDKSNPALFATRWVTHFCAPVFVFLAGVGAGLSRMTKPERAKFLVIRGLWLLLLELTLVRFGFYFTFDYSQVEGLVIWALGWSMVLLAGLQFLPRPVLLAFALVLIFGHNKLGDTNPSILWRILHAHGFIDLGLLRFSAPYKIIPWVAVMALGFWMAPLFSNASRRRIFLGLGLAMILGFVLLRGSNLYGDTAPWKQYPNSIEQTVMSFLNCEKYPPSLCYLLMTLGPAFVFLAVFDRKPGWLARRAIVFGRVPLFFYLLHLPLIHGSAVVVSLIHHGSVSPWLYAAHQYQSKAGYGYSLGIVYVAWVLTLLVLYPLCVWFGGQKKRHPGGWRSYF
jgi:uncharacterized membrane protein